MRIRPLGYKEFILLVLLVLLITQCSERNPKNKLSIQKVGELEFRRSYAEIQFMEMSDEEIESIKKSNPILDHILGKNDSILIEKLRSENILDKDYSLIRQKFNNNNTKKFSLIADNRKEVFCEIKKSTDYDYSGQYDLIVIQGKNKDSIRIAGHYNLLNEGIKYLLFDIVPGGYEEIIFLYEYYIMNGDNSDLFIYEVSN